MEKFLFSKIETWVVLLLALLGVIGAVLFASLVLTASKKEYVLNPVDATAIQIAEVPKNAMRLAFGKNPKRANRTERFGDRGGWTPAKGAAPIVKDGYLLLSRYSGDESRHLVELIDLSDLSTKYTWRPDADTLLQGVPRVSNITKFDRWNTRLYEATHPLLLPDGDLIIKDHQSPLIRTDACSRMKWRYSDDLAHHSTNLDAEGNIWVPTLVDPPTGDKGPYFFEDGIAELSPEDGKLLFSISVPEMLVRHGYASLMFTSGGYLNDPLHLNDIQPVLADGPYWKKGDLLLSMRHKSMILLYRPSTDEIIWQKQGPWLAQHDVDIIDDHTIAVFNNNAFDHGKGWYIDGTNDVTFYDFASDSVSTPYKAAMAKLDVKTMTEGLFDFTDQGRLIVEEENSGRLLILDHAGNLVTEFINRAADGDIYELGWSRYVPQALGDAALKTLSQQDCKGG